MSKSSRALLESILQCKKLKRQFCDGSKMGFRYVGVKRTLAFDSLSTPIEALYLRRAEFIDKPCVSGIACGRKTIITLDNSQMDHIKPLKLCKTEEDVYKWHEMENLQWICQPCNQKKGTSYIQ